MKRLLLPVLLLSTSVNLFSATSVAGNEIGELQGQSATFDARLDLSYLGTLDIWFSSDENGQNEISSCDLETAISADGISASGSFYVNWNIQDKSPMLLEMYTSAGTLKGKAYREEIEWNAVWYFTDKEGGETQQSLSADKNGSLFEYGGGYVSAEGSEKVEISVPVESEAHLRKPDAYSSDITIAIIYNDNN